MSTSLRNEKARAARIAAAQRRRRTGGWRALKEEAAQLGVLVITGSGCELLYNAYRPGERVLVWLRRDAAARLALIPGGLGCWVPATVEDVSLSCRGLLVRPEGQSKSWLVARAELVRPAEVPA